jgi:hypothetical protein
MNDEVVTALGQRCGDVPADALLAAAGDQGDAKWSHISVFSGIHEAIS